MQLCYSSLSTQIWRCYDDRSLALSLTNNWIYSVDGPLLSSLTYSNCRTSVALRISFHSSYFIIPIYEKKEEKKKRDTIFWDCSFSSLIHSFVRSFFRPFNESAAAIVKRYRIELTTHRNFPLDHHGRNRRTDGRRSSSFADRDDSARFDRFYAGRHVDHRLSLHDAQRFVQQRFRSSLHRLARTISEKILRTLHLITVLVIITLELAFFIAVIICCVTHSKSKGCRSYIIRIGVPLSSRYHRANSRHSADCSLVSFRCDIDLFFA